MEQLAGRTAFITGGAQGIGLGIARACGAAGMKIAIVDIDERLLRQAEAELGQTTQAVGHRLDVRDREAYAAVADDVENVLGPVALLVNNAGAGLQTPVGNMSYQAWDWMMTLNLGGVYNGLQTFLPKMIGRGEPAHVVNTASGGGLVANPGFLYACTKYGVVGLSESLRIELSAMKIGISVLCPGPVATSIVDNTLATAPVGDDGRRSTEGAESYFDFMRQLLSTVGRPIDDVGRLVVDAVRRDQFWILTDDTAVAPLRERTEEIAASVPAGVHVTITPEMIKDIPTPRQ